jgi:poly(hydroxyalkanoate) granule-associated protein
MVKRLKDIADASAESKLADTVRDSAQQIWLAGLGAFSKAQEEGVKVFEALVTSSSKCSKIVSRARSTASASRRTAISRR